MNNPSEDVEKEKVATVNEFEAAVVRVKAYEKIVEASREIVGSQNDEDECMRY